MAHLNTQTLLAIAVNEELIDCFIAERYLSGKCSVDETEKVLQSIDAIKNFDFIEKYVNMFKKVQKMTNEHYVVCTSYKNWIKTGMMLHYHDPETVLVG